MNKWTKRAETQKPYMDLGRLAHEAGITAEEKPIDLPSRPGFAWKPYLNTAAGSIGWEEVEDPNAMGTADKPIEWEPGMTVQVNYWYTYEDILYVCVQNGNPDEISTEYFEVM